MSKANQGAVKKVLVRNCTRPLTSGIVPTVNRLVEVEVPNGDEANRTEFRRVPMKPMSSACSTSTDNSKPRSLTLNQKITRKLNFHPHERVFKNLVPLEEPKIRTHAATQTSRKSYPTRPKDIVPVLQEVSKLRAEINSQPITLTKKQRKCPRRRKSKREFNPFAISNSVKHWETAEESDSSDSCTSSSYSVHSDQSSDTYDSLYSY